MVPGLEEVAETEENVMKYIQIGVTALRDPATGEFLPSVPLFIQAREDEPEQAEELAEKLGPLFADMIRAERQAS